MTVTHVFFQYVSACPRCQRIKRGTEWTDEFREPGQPANSEWCSACLALERARIRAHLQAAGSQ